VSAAPLEPEYEPRLAEAAVLHAVRHHPDERRFHAEREAAYAIADPEPREAAFDTLHGRWFARLGLDRPFRAALTEQPRVADGCGRWLVVSARGRRDEAGDLLVGAGARPTLVLRVTAETVADGAKLWPLLRRELLHVADMLDPAFGYEPALPAEVPRGRERALRANYRVLWNAYVDGRLVRLGALPTTVLDDHRRTFARAGVAHALEELCMAGGITHRRLLALAGGVAPGRG
jgi:hypothetical protein